MNVRFDAICRMAESGIGLAVLPQTAAQRAQRSMAIRIIPLADPWARRRHAAHSDRSNA
jgi:DNA-binding transcriptional LysR family regulator